jgi:hypothetical protein
MCTVAQLEHASLKARALAAISFAREVDEAIAARREERRASGEGAEDRPPVAIEHDDRGRAFSRDGEEVTVRRDCELVTPCDHATLPRPRVEREDLPACGGDHARAVGLEPRRAPESIGGDHAALAACALLEHELAPRTPRT